jgi:putative sporulation protein YtaF
MHTLYTLFIALANNLDNIGVRIAYSIRGIKITTAKNLWISVITFIISSLAAFSGSFISKMLNKNTASIISMVLLIIIGLWIIIEPYTHKNKKESDDIDIKNSNIYDILVNPEKADKDKSNDIDFKEATFLGIALSINNVGGGLSAGMIGLNAFFVGFFSAVISFLALFAGNYITDFFKRWNLEKRATILSGLILILIGIKQVL